MTTNSTSHPVASTAGEAWPRSNGIAHKALKFTVVRGRVLWPDGNDLQKHPAPESVRLMFGAIGAMGVGDSTDAEPEVLAVAASATQIAPLY